MLVMMCIVVWLKPAPENILFAAALALVLVISVLCFLPGNWIAAFPYAVALEEGKGLVLYAPLKKVYIPIDDVQDIRRSFLQQGYVVRLKRRSSFAHKFCHSSVFWRPSRAARSCDSRGDSPESLLSSSYPRESAAIELKK